MSLSIGVKEKHSIHMGQHSYLQYHADNGIDASSNG